MESSTITYDQLLEEVKKIPMSEPRMDFPNIMEFVMRTDFVMRLHVAFQKFFGEDFKAPGETPTTNDRRRAIFLGGIRPDQTLYFTETDEFAHCAMLWPWSDGRRVTVRIGCKTKSLSTQKNHH